MLDPDPYQFVQTTKHKDDNNKYLAFLYYNLNYLARHSVRMAKHFSHAAAVPTEISWLSSIGGVLFLLRHLKRGEPDL